jgi:hypothetical protein
VAGASPLLVVELVLETIALALPDAVSVLLTVAHAVALPDTLVLPVAVAAAEGAPLPLRGGVADSSALGDDEAGCETVGGALGCAEAEGDAVGAALGLPMHRRTTTAPSPPLRSPGALKSYTPPLPTRPPG